MYKRVIIKMSGEALKGKTEFGIDPKTVSKYAKEIKEVYDLGVEVGIVIGGGNIWRGKLAAEMGMDRSQADYMGMLATIINGLALQDALLKLGIPTRVASALEVNQVSERYIRRKVLKHLSEGNVYIFVGGTGSPYFSTDTAATLRAAELNADAVLMAKNGVDGVYNKDPRKHKDAFKYDKLTHQTLINENLKVIDLTAASMASENNIDLVIFDIEREGNFRRAVLKEKIGTIIKEKV